MSRYAIIFAFFWLFLNSLLPIFSQNRNLQSIYPNLLNDKIAEINTAVGLIQTIENTEQKPLFEPNLQPYFPFNNYIKQIKPSFIIESARVVPLTNSVSITNVYIALNRIRDLSGRTYKSASRGKEIPLFEYATRINSIKNPKPVQDSTFINNSFIIPSQELFYILLKDANFGDSYYSVEMKKYDKGLLFILTNEKKLSYGIIPIITENRFKSILYIEPVVEGLFLYNQAGAQVSSFISSQVHMPSAIRKRLDVFIDWLVDGLNR